MKTESEKPRPTLLPWTGLREVVQVMTDGAKKHGDRGWRLADPVLYEDALLRHAMSFGSGARTDAESRSKTLAHIAANALILLEHPGEDRLIKLDQPIPYTPAEPPAKTTPSKPGKRCSARRR